MEGGSCAGMSGHHAGNVDPPERVAAARSPNAAGESCFCLVTPRRKMKTRLALNTPFLVQEKKGRSIITDAVSFI